MADSYKSTKFNAILHLSKKANISKVDLCRALNISRPTLERYLERPHIIELGQIITMCGLFGVSAEALVYLLIRTQPQEKVKDKWYLEGVKLEADKHIGE